MFIYIKAMKTWTPEEIKEFRKRLNLYQKDFAQRIGVTMRYVIYLEQGVRQPSKTLKILLIDDGNRKGNEDKEREVQNHGKGKGIYKRGKVYWIAYAGLDGKVIRESSKSDKFKDAETLLIKDGKVSGKGRCRKPSESATIPSMTLLRII